MTAETLQKTEPGSVTFDTLPEPERNRVLAIKKTIVFDDSQTLAQYGVAVQSNIADFSDSILSEIRNKDAGFAGAILSDLLGSIKELNVDSLGAKSPLASLPIIGGLVNAARRFIERYEKLSSQIERIVNDLEKTRMQLLRDITLLDKLFDKNWEYLRELDLHIVAGKLVLDELREKVIPDLKKSSETSNDPRDAQKLRDAVQFVDRFDKKVHDLLLSRMVSIQTAPQIRLIQNNNQLLVEKIQTSILNTIPLWKSQIVIAITLFRQKKALALQKEVSDTTNELLVKNSDLLKTSSIETARESERGIVDMETLKKVNGDLIATIEETLRIQNDGREKRAAAEEELKKIETELRQKIAAVRGTE